MKKAKQVMAIIGIVVIITMYIISFIAALMASEAASGLFRASVFCTIAVPIVLYGLLIVYKRIHKDDDNTMSLRKFKKTLKKDENSDKSIKP